MIDRFLRFNHFANNSNIKLIKAPKNFSRNTTEYISNGKYLKIEPTDLSVKDKCIAYCFEFTFVTISPSVYVIIKTRNIISSGVEINENYFLAIKSDKLVNALKVPVLPHFLRFFKQLKEEGKIKCDNIDEKLLKYIELNKTELDYMMVKK